MKLAILLIDEGEGYIKCNEHTWLTRRMVWAGLNTQPEETYALHLTCTEKKKKTEDEIVLVSRTDATIPKSNIFVLFWNKRMRYNDFPNGFNEEDGVHHELKRLLGARRPFEPN